MQVGSAMASSGGGGPYSNLEDSNTVGEGKDFTQKQKQNIIEENMKNNGGEVKSDMSGKELVKPEKSQKGIPPSQDEWQIDHIIPKDKGGSNSYILNSIKKRNV
ncbi:hypothetical protein Hs30E_20590 [Lactococcus hodotermopsidis]|uniref:Uncharacterized protein n=1 Tax=Pseudolactococcus hodotermopsidis TaxID=2709157 RepID=A0A6A0BGK8_9LACT|nr:HNH endonuclease signature motif containing protein [Lactococcus hodotermopsidis]GFH43498.1 hypothetical protein Hs30E_20590 [Lactococcus hodotermopsidis]